MVTLVLTEASLFLAHILIYCYNCHFQAIPQVAIIPKAVRKRTVVCPTCSKPGHYAKTCPNAHLATGANIGAAIIDPPATRTTAPKKKKTPTATTGRAMRARNANESGESGDDHDENVNAIEHPLDTNVHGLPVAIPDFFANAPTGDIEAEIDDTDSVFNENPTWALSLIHNEDRATRTSIQQTNMPVFRGPRAGPKNIPAACKSPLDFFLLFMSTDILDQFVASSNEFAAATKIRGWSALSSNELLVFFAIVTYLGVVKVPNRRAAWSKESIFSQTFLKSSMTAKRFEDILKALHWTNTAGMTDEAKAKSKAESTFWQVDGFLLKLSINCRHYFVMGQHFDIDEMCIYFKGRHISRCYNPSKPEKWHLKFFALNDGLTGYLFNFYPYQGATERRPAEWGATAYPVYKLLRHLDELHNVNHVLHVDNWYNQFQVAKYARLIGMHSNDTIKTNRKGLNKQFLFKNTGATKHDNSTLLSFTTALIQEIVVKHDTRDVVVCDDLSDDEKPVENPHRKCTWVKESERRLNGRHMPAHTSRTEGSRRRCMVCKTKTAYSCIQCNVGLCIDDPASTSCFEIFHSLEEF